MAAVAAGTAAAEQPTQAAAIAKAAGKAAPAKAGKIFTAVCAAVPKEWAGIAIAVSEAAPTSGKDILKSVGSVEPSLKPYIDKELAGYGFAPPPVAATLNRVAGNVAKDSSASPASRAAVSGAPYVPPAGTASGAQPNLGNPPYKGGRNYAVPR
jgi:hypothetical protein